MWWRRFRNTRLADFFDAWVCIYFCYFFPTMLILRSDAFIFLIGLPLSTEVSSQLRFPTLSDGLVFEFIGTHACFYLPVFLISCHLLVSIICCHYFHYCYALSIAIDIRFHRSDFRFSPSAITAIVLLSAKRAACWPRFLFRYTRHHAHAARSQHANSWLSCRFIHSSMPVFISDCRYWHYKPAHDSPPLLS